MTNLKPDPDAVERCYAALVDEPAADTCCKRIRVFVERMHADGRREPHDQHLIVLATQLMNETRSFGVYLLALNGLLDDEDFAGALQVGRAMIEHEAMLSDVAAGKQVSSTARLN